MFNPGKHPPCIVLVSLRLDAARAFKAAVLEMTAWALFLTLNRSGTWQKCHHRLRGTMVL